MADTENVVAHRLVAKNASGQVVSTQYVAPDKARYAKKLMLEEGFDVEETPMDELPEGIELDVR